MQNRKLSAALSAVAVAYFAWSIFGATEAPSPTLALVQWSFLAVAVLTLVFTLYKMARGE